MPESIRVPIDGALVEVVPVEDELLIESRDEHEARAAVDVAGVRARIQATVAPGLHVLRFHDRREACDAWHALRGAGYPVQPVYSRVGRPSTRIFVGSSLRVSLDPVRPPMRVAGRAAGGSDMIERIECWAAARGLELLELEPGSRAVLRERGLGAEPILERMIRLAARDEVLGVEPAAVVTCP